MRLSPSTDYSKRENRPAHDFRGHPLKGSILFVLVVLTSIIFGAFSSDSLKDLKANLTLVRHPEFASTLFDSNDLPTINLDIKFNYYSKIVKKRREALAMNRLVASDEDFVPGKITYQGETTDCKIRLKGDLPQHWSGRKWSLRIHVRRGETLMGMKRFSFQDPVTRNNTYEWLFLKNLRMEGVLAPRYNFINLAINGKSMGIFAMEEHFSKEMIEHQKRREGIVLSFDEHHMWNLHWNVSWPSAYRTAGIEVRNSSRIETSEALHEQQITAVNLLRGLQERKLSGDEVFETDKLGKFLALSHLWGAEHGFSYADINFYYDPITAKLEPVGMDAKPSLKATNPGSYFSDGEMEDTWINHALRSPKVGYDYIKHLDAFSKPAYLSKLRQTLASKENSLRRLLIKELLLENRHYIWKSGPMLLEYEPWKLLEERAAMIRRGLDDRHIALVFGRPHDGNSSDSFDVIVRNALTQPIEIIGFKSGQQSWLAKDTVHIPSKEKIKLCPRGENVVLPLREWANDHPRGDYHFLLENNSSTGLNKENNSELGHLTALVRILGLGTPLELSVLMDSVKFQPESLPFHSMKSDPCKIHPFLRKEGFSLFVPEGDHKVTEDLAISDQYELVLEEGATLRFAKRTALISEGVVRALGTMKNPVTLTSLDETWGGALVKNTTARSEWRHVHVFNVSGIGSGIHAKGINRAGWTLTGGITFYHSDADFLHCKFANSTSEDALNIISSDFSLSGCTFHDLASDAFDGDFVRGLVRDCTFERIGGDAIDLSGSDVKIKNVRVFGTADKAVSAGEGSQVTLSDCRFEDIGFGIASKDLSEVRVDNLHIVKARVAALAAYQKKSLFGPSTISAQGLKVSETSKHYLVQKGSSATINGKNVEGIELDVDSLYQEKSSPK